MRAVNCISLNFVPSEQSQVMGSSFHKWNFDIHYEFKYSLAGVCDKLTGPGNIQETGIYSPLVPTWSIGHAVFFHCSLC